jgi:hypothetical protein
MCLFPIPKMAAHPSYCILMSAGTAVAVSMIAGILEPFLSIGRYNKGAHGKTKPQARL